MLGLRVISGFCTRKIIQLNNTAFPVGLNGFKNIFPLASCGGGSRNVNKKGGGANVKCTHLIELRCHCIPAIKHIIEREIRF